MRLIIQDLWYMPFVYVINFWLSERGGDRPKRGDRPKGGAPHFPPVKGKHTAIDLDLLGKRQDFTFAFSYIFQYSCKLHVPDL